MAGSGKVTPNLHLCKASHSLGLYRVAGMGSGHMTAHLRLCKTSYGLAVYIVADMSLGYHDAMLTLVYDKLRTASGSSGLRVREGTV